MSYTKGYDLVTYATCLRSCAAGWAANHWGWQWGMWVQGAIGLSLALFCLATMKDSPKQSGYSAKSRHNPEDTKHDNGLNKRVEDKENTGRREAFIEVI